jgi:hypothetical protein
VKNFLMDAAVVVGVGNIYACESLHRAGIHPASPARRLAAARWQRLHTAVLDVLRRAVGDGGTTLNDFRDAAGNRGAFQYRLQVYGRGGEPCRRCGRGIRRIVQAVAARSTARAASIDCSPVSSAFTTRVFQIHDCASSKFTTARFQSDSVFSEKFGPDRIFDPTNPVDEAVASPDGGGRGAVGAALTVQVLPARIRTMVRNSNAGSKTNGSGRAARRRDERRLEILSAAARGFRDRGFAATGMRDIAAAADLSPANLYHYFRGKQELLYFCQAASLERLSEGLDAARRSGAAAAEQLESIIATHLRCVLGEMPAAAAHLEVDALEPELRTRIVAGRDRYERGIRRIVAAGVAER